MRGDALGLQDENNLHNVVMLTTSNLVLSNATLLPMYMSQLDLSRHVGYVGSEALAQLT